MLSGFFCLSLQTNMKQMITILGPTASGKTLLAADLAHQINGEIISADSRQVYRRMDIGTGKDLEDYQGVPYHLIDIVEPGTKYNLFQYQQDFYDAYRQIVERGVTPILCGGTGLYIEAVLKGYKLSPSCQRAIRAIEIEEYNLHTPTPKRELPPVDSLVIGVDIDREERRQKITRRLKQRLENGMVEEVKGLLDEGIPAEDLIYYGLEYKFVTEYITGQLTYDEMFKRLEIAIHQFAKRQMTWFRGMERRGFTIHWIDAMQPMEEKVAQILEMTK